MRSKVNLTVGSVARRITLFTESMTNDSFDMVKGFYQCFVI